MGSFARGKLRRLEAKAAGFYNTLRLPDGAEVRYTGEEEMLDVVIAALDGEEHRLLPHLRKMDQGRGVPVLIRAIEGSEDDG
jgi:hypothetical protein